MNNLQLIDEAKEIIALLKKGITVKYFDNESFAKVREMESSGDPEVKYGAMPPLKNACDLFIQTEALINNLITSLITELRLSKQLSDALISGKTIIKHEYPMGALEISQRMDEIALVLSFYERSRAR